MKKDLILSLLSGFVIVFSLGCPGDDTDPRGDTTPPSIETVSPAEGAVDVPVSAVVRVIFSENIDTNRITPATFGISPSVAGSFAFNGDTVTYNPTTGLLHATEYTVSITTGITDLAGNALPENKNWSFTTAGNPATTPPVVISTDPVHLATNVDASAPISATFSKTMNANTASFSLSPDVSEFVFSWVDSTLVVAPSQSLLFNTQYTARLDSTMADTFGNKLAAPYVWSFTTGADPMTPLAYVESPIDGAIIGDTVTIEIVVVTVDSVDVTKVEFYIDGQHVVDADDYSAPYEFLWDASGEALASERSIHARAYEAGGRVGFSEPITLFHEWEILATDSNDPWLTDIKRIMARSTDTTIEFRYEFWEPWFDPYDSIADDTTLDMAIYLDTDQNPSTGRTTFGKPGFEIPLNGLGADHRVIIGIHGWDTTFARWTGVWEKIYDYNGFKYFNLQPYESTLEFGMRWTDLDNPVSMNMLSINVFWISTDALLPDWAPDQGLGYITIPRENRYLGEGYIESSSRRQRRSHEATAVRENPFR